MNDFTASNGYVVSDTGSDAFTTRVVVMDKDGENTLSGEYVSGNDYLDGHDMRALREFFRAEEDARLGRWRWPENRDIYVTSEHVGFVDVVDERDPANPSAWERGWRDAKTEMDRAAVAYFDAHPEPKPWHDATPGQVWDIDLPSGGMRAVTVYSGRHPEPITVFRDAFTQVEVETDDESIRDARCIFPGAES